MGIDRDRFGWVVLPHGDEHTIEGIIAYLNQIGQLTGKLDDTFEPKLIDSSLIWP